VDRDQALEAARSISELGAAHGDETEQGRRLAAPVVAAMEASGLNALMSPRELGGFAAEPSLMCEVVEQIARGDASTGWCAGIGMGSNFMSGLITETAAKAIFTRVNRGGAGPFAPGGRAVVAGDGYRITGRWPYSSNCHQAAVAACGMITFADGKPTKLNAEGVPTIELAYLTRDQFEIDETWNTLGMRGTGSHDIVVTDAEISVEATSTLFDTMWPDDALFRLRSFDILGPCLGVVPLGIGRAALDVVKEKAVAEADGPPARGPRPRIMDDVHGQLELGLAETRLRAARALILDAVDDAYSYALDGKTPPRTNTAVIGLAIYEIFQAANQAVSTAISLLGSAAIRDGSKLDRLRRDLDTAGTHVMLRPGLVGLLGRELAGIPTDAFPYLPPPE
jgi:alkylation response protein AidB-like acyl-CoA dehydrogenase